MQFIKQVLLQKLNTFGIQAKANLFIEVANEQDFKALIKTDEFKKNKHLILGGGSNILLTDDYDGLVIKNNLKGIYITKENDDSAWITVKSGEIWHEFVMHCIDNNLGGLENLSLIPGTVGAAPMQNIGAYGVEIKDTFETLTAIHLVTGETKVFTNNDCQFGYRESVFKHALKGQFFITSVTFKLTKENHKLNTSYGAIIDTLGNKNPTIKSVSDAVIKIRQSKLPNPAEIGNSGSFFKNPTIDKIDFEGLKAEFPTIPGYVQPRDKVKVPAGWLIEQCDWKGKRVGEVGVHSKQALVLVNYGEGKGTDIKQLAQAIQKSVVEKFGIELHPEVNFV